MEFKIIIKKINNSLSNEEEIIFQQWINESDKHRQYFEQVKGNYYNEIGPVNAKKSWRVLNRKINKRNIRPIQTSKIVFWKIAAVAASITILIGISYLFINDTPPAKNHITCFHQHNDIIVPGSHKAILTLNNGYQIALGTSKKYNLHSCQINNKQIIYRQNKNKGTDKIQYNEITTPIGGEYQIILADGTHVWLNSDSKLKYPEHFLNGKPREVELLHGEAYFEVSPANKHNGAHFIVKTDRQSVNVIGTEFNIRAYAKERTISTTLVKGVVNVSIGTLNQTLKPTQQSNFDKENITLSKETVDVYDIVAWKDGIFSFTNRPLEEITIVLERWYNVKIVIENESLKQIRFSGIFCKDQNLNNILSIIQKTNIIKYQSSNKIVVLK